MEWSYESVKMLWKDRNIYQKENKQSGFMKFSVIAGIIIGLTSYVILPKNIIKNEVLTYVIGIITIYIANILHIIIHETGHLIGGAVKSLSTGFLSNLFICIYES